MKRIAVLTSGGDAPGMNAAIRAVVHVAADQGIEVLGVERGYDGLMEGAMTLLSRWVIERGAPLPVPATDTMGGLGGTVLGSTRSEGFFTPEGRAKAASKLNRAGAEGLVVIGGSGSMAGAHALSTEHEVPVVGIPASIDNDIGLTREALGVDTALNTIVEAVDRISDTARSHRRAFVIEVMGRESGYLAMAAAVATAADAVLLPEHERSYDQIIGAVATAIRSAFARSRDKKRVVVIKAEGIDIPTHHLVNEVSAELEDIPQVEVRGTVLGHVVRGGNPSFRDRLLAGRFGLTAMETLVEGDTDVMVGWTFGQDRGRPSSDTFIRVFSLSEVLAETEALKDGTAEVTMDRVRRMEAIQGVLAL